jgi:hypothetical protein
MRALVFLAPLALLAACAAPNPTVQFVPSKKSAVELRAAQTRMVPEDSDDVIRGVIATLQDLGYRITRVESDAGTVSATRQTALRMAVVVQPRSPQESVVRANATIVTVLREAQVDSPEFYQKDFFAPLGDTLQRTLADVPDGVAAPDPVHPAAELNTIKEREAATPKAPGSGSPGGTPNGTPSATPNGTPSATGTKTP